MKIIKKWKSKKEKKIINQKKEGNENPTSFCPTFSIIQLWIARFGINLWENIKYIKSMKMTKIVR